MEGQGRQFNQRLKAYFVYKYLLEHSDENHWISAEDISAHLLENYGIPAERRSIYKDIEAINVSLCAMRVGRKIDSILPKLQTLKDDSWKAILYDGTKKGYYVKHRLYDTGEQYSLNDVKTIAECIYSSKFITKKQADTYVNIITKVLASEEQAKEVIHDSLLLDSGKALSNEVFKNIRIINKAIQVKSGKIKHTPEKISFKYVSRTIDGTEERRHGELYIVSPYRIVINDGNYYLLGYDDKLAAARTYRIDRMREIKRLGLPRDGGELFIAVDEKTLALKSFGMYDGKKEYVTLRFINPLLDTAIDKFGDKVHYYKDDDKHFSVQVQVPITDQFFGWLCGLGKRVKIISPPPVQEKFKEYLEKIRSIY